MTFTIFSPPRTKKTHNRLMRGQLFPSKQFEEWNASAQMQLAKVRAASSAKLPITQPVSIKAIFYREANTGDLHNYFQALADALQEGGIIQNDSLVRSWDGSRVLRDQKDPRIEVEIMEFAV